MGRIWTVTKGVQPIAESGSCEVAQSLLWGFRRGIAVEHPQLWGGLIRSVSRGIVSGVASKECQLDTRRNILQRSGTTDRIPWPGTFCCQAGPR